MRQCIPVLKCLLVTHQHAKLYFFRIISPPGHNILTTDHSVLTLTYVISNAFPEIQSLPNNILYLTISWAYTYISL